MMVFPQDMEVNQLGLKLEMDDSYGAGIMLEMIETRVELIICCF